MSVSADNSRSPVVSGPYHKEKTVLSAIMTTATALALMTPTGEVRGAIPDLHRSVVSSAQDSGFAKQTSKGRVELELLPQWRDGQLILQVRANTHTVDLATLNLGEQVRLTVNGITVAPASAGRLSGHHAVSEIVFPLAERPDSFAITIRDLPDVPAQTLTWPPTVPKDRP